MSSASSTRTFLTFCPSGPVWCVTSCMPRIFLASSTASSGLFASLTPPPLPRPPAWICALTTARPPNSFAIRPASSGRVRDRPRGVATPKPRRISFAWYSWIFMGPRKGIRRKTARSMMKLPHILAFALAVPGPLAAQALAKTPSRRRRARAASRERRGVAREGDRRGAEGGGSGGAPVPFRRTAEGGAAGREAARVLGGRGRDGRAPEVVRGATHRLGRGIHARVHELHVREAGGRAEAHVPTPTGGWRACFSRPAERRAPTGRRRPT